MEEKLREFEIKIIEYEDDLTQLKDEKLEFQTQNNHLKIQNARYLKRIKELNNILFDLAEGKGDKFLAAARGLRDGQKEEGSKSTSELQAPKKEISIVNNSEEGEDSPQVISLSPSERDNIGFADAVSA